MKKPNKRAVISLALLVLLSPIILLGVMSFFVMDCARAGYETGGYLFEAFDDWLDK